MEEMRLTRETIALSVLNGIVGSMGTNGALGDLQDGQYEASATRQQAVTVAFQMADLFMQERDKKA